jgi:hypothetical protein
LWYFIANQNNEKRNGQNKLWQRITGSDGQFKYDIDSILDEQINYIIVLLRDVFHIGLVIGPRPAVLA